MMMEILNKHVNVLNRPMQALEDFFEEEVTVYE
mgnify:CR=1 FL=1